MLTAAAAECRRRAATNRQNIKSRFTGRRRGEELAAARREAEADLQATLAALRRDHGSLRGMRRRKLVLAMA